MRRPPIFSFFVASILSLATLSSAIVVTSPTATTTWGTTGGNAITWSLTPATSPLPTSQYFQIFIINATPLYNPILNVSIAQYVNGLGTPSIEFELAGQLLPGNGYRLLFTSPSDGSLVYCESEVFQIGSGSGSTSASSTSTASSATKTGKGTGSATTTSPLHAATAPGSIAEQGFNLGFSGTSGGAKKGTGVAVMCVLGTALVMAFFF